MIKSTQKKLFRLLFSLTFILYVTCREESQTSFQSPANSASEYPPPPKTFTLPLSNYYNHQYSGRFQIGQNNKPFDLIIDTGFPWIWVSPYDVKEGDFSSVSTYKCSGPKCKSEEEAQKEEFTYISKSEVVKGDLVTDDVSFGNDQQTNINQMFLLSKPSDYINTLYSDGLCGLSRKNSHDTPTILDTLHGSGHINKKIFGLYLSDNPEAFNETTSEITFGGPSLQYRQAEFTDVKVLDSQYWQVNLGGLYLSTKSLDTASVTIKANTAIFASGVNNIIMSKDDFTALHSVFRTSYKLDCSSGFHQELVCVCSDGDISQFPNLSFKLDSKLFTIPPSLYLEVKENSCVILIEGSLENSKQYMESKESNAGETQNISNSLNLNDGSFIVLGSVFLRNFYTVFNAEEKIVSLTKVIRPSMRLITALEIIYLIFGAFILVMFLIFLGCFIQICFTKKTSSTEKISLEKNLIDKKKIPNQFVQILESH